MRGTILNALRVALRIISGKIILYFGTPERLRTLLCSIFTGGVVTENSSCSAAFCESAVLRGYPLRLTTFASSPKGELNSLSHLALLDASSLGEGAGKADRLCLREFVPSSLP